MKKLKIAIGLFLVGLMCVAAISFKAPEVLYNRYFQAYTDVLRHDSSITLGPCIPAKARLLITSDTILLWRDDNLPIGYSFQAMDSLQGIHCERYDGVEGIFYRYGDKRDQKKDMVLLQQEGRSILFVELPTCPDL